MDPISQGAVGAAFGQASQTVSSLRSGRDRSANEQLVAISWLACLSGMAPDLDVLIQSSTDPLLFLEFHRHFTHALVFIPIGALIVCGALYWSVRRTLTWHQAYLACLVGYATHGLLDACTSYGTQLFWPFSDVRVAWNNVSVVDPLLTIPLVVCTILAARNRKAHLSLIGIGWMFIYLGIGVWQMNRALEATQQIALSRNHTANLVTVKPSFANLLVWKSIYEADGTFYVDAVRVGFNITYCPGDSAPRLNVKRDLAFLDQESQQARDVARFDWFSDGYLALHEDAYTVIDLRYSIVPNQIDPMWGIRLNPAASPDTHVEWFSTRETSRTETDQFWRMLSGADCSIPLGMGTTK